jgi:hypothetical protein
MSGPIPTGELSLLFTESLNTTFKIEVKTDIAIKCENKHNRVL